MKSSTDGEGSEKWMLRDSGRQLVYAESLA